MDVFNRIMTRLFDGVFFALHAVGSVWGIIVLGIITGVVLVWLFGKISNQRAIGTLKSRVKGHLLEMWIFRQSSRAMFRAQYRLVKYGLKYLAVCLASFAPLMVPMALIMIQMQARYGYEPLRPSQSAILRIVYNRPVSLESMDAALEVPEGITVETPPLRIPESREVVFRIRADTEGRHALGVKTQGEVKTKTISVGDTGQPISPQRSIHLGQRLIYPAEPGLRSQWLSSIELEYPSRFLHMGGLEMHWVWVFLIVSILAGMVVKNLLKIEL